MIVNRDTKGRIFIKGDINYQREKSCRKRIENEKLSLISWCPKWINNDYYEPTIKIAGYMPWWKDFETEFDYFAENHI